MRVSLRRPLRRRAAASITDMGTYDDGADALEKQVHAVAIAEAVIEFARLTCAQNRTLDPAFILQLPLAETLAALAYDHGVDAETAMRGIEAAVQFRIARREAAETPAAPTPPVLH